MRVTAKASLFIAVILIVLTGALVLASTSVITSVVGDLNTQLLNLELSNVRKNLEQRHQNLVRARVDGIESYVDLARKRALEHFRAYHYGKTGELHIFGPNGEALMGPEAVNESVALALRNSVARDESVLSYSTGNELRMGVHLPFPQWNWSLVLTVSEDEIFAGRNVYLRNVALLAVAVFLIIICLTYVLSMRTVRRLRGILTCAESAREGNLEARVRVEDELDEIGQLGRGINEMIQRRQQAEEELQQLNRELEDRVASRTRDLEEALEQIKAEVQERRQAQEKLAELNKDIQRASRLAGMAEVASGVLHNIGNVLNSVNVSASVIAKKMRESRLEGLEKVTDMLSENLDDPKTFLTEDQKGRELIPYLRAFHSHLEREREAITNETQLLSRYIEHIRDVVRMQQDYARTSRYAENVTAEELVEDAYRITADTLKKHSIEVRREYEARPTLTVERHKVLQILVNLIRNARDALESIDPDMRSLSLRVMNGNEDMVQFSVGDNGTGILPENLTRIFQHGFTTRPDGHGFGLHSSALSARQLGGNLTVKSGGIGKGAVFTLEVPMEGPPDVPDALDSEAANQEMP